MAGSRARAKAKVAEEVDTTPVAGEIDEDQLSMALGNLQIHESGVALDTSDPNYEQLKRIEDLKVEIRDTQYAGTEAGQAYDDTVRQAQMDAEEARLRAQLVAAQNAARESVSRPGADGLLDTINAQREQAEAAEAAAKANSEGQ